MANKVNRRWILWFIVIVIAVTLIPYLYGFAIQDEKSTFSGFFIGVEDQNSYISKMREGYEGDWLFRTPYSAFPQKGILVYLPFILLGKLAGGKELHGQFLFLFQLFRIGGIFLFVYSLERFCSLFLHESWSIKTAMVLSVFGGGLGWLYFVGLSGLWQGGLPLEYYSPEAFNFLLVLTLPHLVVGRALLFLGLYHWIKQTQWQAGKTVIGYPVLCGIIGIGIYIFQPITFLIYGLVIMTYTALTILDETGSRKSGKSSLAESIRKYFRPVFYFGLILLPFIIYNVYLLAFEPFVQVWSKQNVLTSPPILDYVLAYGLAAVPAGFGLYGLMHKNKTVAYFFVIWIVAGISMVYIPVSIQRRFVEGIWVAIILLAVMGIRAIGNQNLRKRIMAIFVTLTLLSTVFTIIGTVMQIKQKRSPIFIPEETMQVYQYINQTFTQEDYIFADHSLSNGIPAWTSAKTIVGLGPESIGEPDILAQYNAVLDGKTSPESWLTYLQMEHVKAYIIEKQNQSVFPHCNSIMQNESYSVCLVPYEK